MSKSVYKFRVFCQTENEYVYTWNDESPQVCPNNGSHTIDDNTVTIIDTVSTNTVQIAQETMPTGGNYRAESKKLTIPANATQSFDFQWPYQLSVLTLTFYSGQDNGNDIINTFIAPNTTIGVLTGNVSQDDTILNVNSTVTDNIHVGYRVDIFNGVSVTHVGECIAINKTNGTITLDTQCQQSFSQGCAVQICINNIKNFALRSNTNYELARKTIGASSLPANTIVRLQYQNTSNSTKDFFFAFEYYY